MKRILALTLSLAMLAGLMTVSAVAAESSTLYNEGSSNVEYDATGPSGEHESHKNTSHGGGVVAGTGDNPTNYPEDDVIATGSVGVKGWTNTNPGSVTHVYAVSITTTELTFSYGNAGTSYIWDPSKLQYVSQGTSDGGWQEKGQEILVTNYSDLPVDVTAEYASQPGFGAISGTITDTDDTNPDGTISLAAATTGIEENYSGIGTKVDGKFTLALSTTAGSTPALGTQASPSTIGTVTLTFKVPTTAGG